MNKITLPSIDEIIEINKKLGYTGVNKGALDFILTKIKSRKPAKDLKKNISYAASVLWYEIITQHPFLDGNKRTAAESMKHLIETNNFGLDIPMNGVIYISLKIANNDITFNNLNQFIYEKLK